MARYENKQSVGSLLAAADLSAKKHYLVKVSAANAINLAGVGDTAIGALMNEPVSGDVAEVAVGVVVPVVAGEVIAAGANVAPDATGRARTAVTDDHICGIALEGAGAAGCEFACLMLPQTQSLDQDGHVEEVGVAATKTITAGNQVCLDTDGYLVASNDATAVSFWGFALDTVDNSGGLDGALNCSVRRWGIATQVSAGLAATDVGKEVWQVTNAGTVTTTPGNILVGIIDTVISAISCVVSYKAMPIVGQRTDRRFVIGFGQSGATLNGASAFTDREFPRKYLPLSMYIDAEAAPGGADVLTATLTDATNTYVATITAAAVHGENKVPAVLAAAMKANFDTDLTLADTGTTTADVRGEILCEAL